MSSTLKRVLSVTAILLSGLVILLCAAGIIGVWASSGKVIAAGTGLITAAENAAAAFQTGLGAVDNGLSRLEEDTQAIQEASAQLSQNISDKGLILVLLPPAREEKLVNTVTSIKETLSTVGQVLSSFTGTYQAIDSLPFISLPKPSAETMDALTTKTDKLAADVKELQTLIQAARDNSAGAAQKISDAVASFNNDIRDARTEVQARSDQLAATQAALSSAKNSFSFWVYLGAALITLLLGWVGYTQVLIIQLALSKYRSA